MLQTIVGQRFAASVLRWWPLWPEAKIAILTRLPRRRSPGQRNLRSERGLGTLESSILLDSGTYRFLERTHGVNRFKSSSRTAHPARSGAVGRTGRRQRRRSHVRRTADRHADRRRAEGQLSDLRDERDRQPGLARRPRRSEALAAPHPGRHERPEPDARRGAGEVREDLRRHQRQLSSARRERDLSHAGPHGPGVEHAARAGRQAGQLRLDRRSARRGHAVHRGPHVAHRRDAAGRHQAGHGRFRSHLRRAADRAERAAVEVSQPAGQRGERHRGGHGHVDPAAQPGRNLRRPGPRDRRAGGVDRRAAGDRAGPRFSHRRRDLRPGGHPPRLPHRAEHDRRPRPGEHRRAQQAVPHRDYGDPLPAGPRPHRGADRRAGQRGEDRRHFRHPQRERPEGAGPPGLRPEARRRSRRGAQPALPVLAAARQFLADLPGAGRRQAAGAVVQGDAGGVHPAPRDGDPPADAVPAGPGPAAQAHGRGAAAGPRQHRRGDPRDPRPRRPRPRPRSG